jgi:hypothetical protein
VLDSGVGKRTMTMRTSVVADSQLAPALTMTLPFMFGWIEHK